MLGLPRGPHATRWFAHLSWTNTTKHVLKVYRDALDSMIEDQVHCFYLFINIVNVKTHFALFFFHVVYLGTVFR